MSTPVKVLRLVTRLNVGGPAQNVAYLSDGLKSRGFITTLVSGRIDPGEGDMAYFTEGRGVSIRYIDGMVRPITPMKDLLAFVDVLRLMWRERPDVLHTHLAKAGFLGRLAATVLSPFGVRPAIFHTYHGHVFHSYFTNSRNSLHLFLERFCASRTDRIIAVSERLKTELIHAYEIAPAEKFTVIPLGFDLAPFVGAPRGSGAFRAKIGVDAQTPLIGIVGRLTAVKDHILFLNSFMEILKTMPAAVAVIVGDGEEKAAIHAHADRLGIPGRIRWTGFMRDLTQVYSDLTLLALTSKNEGTPVAVIEAQSAGCPVVASDVGGTADAMLASADGDGDADTAPPVRRMATGFLVRRHEPGHFAEACLRILTGAFSPEPGARDKIAAKFGWERLCDDTAALYMETLAKRSER